MDRLLSFLLKLLILTVILFLIAVIIYLFYCQCARPIRGAGEVGQPVNSASAGPNRVSGRNFPAFQPRQEAEQHNDDRARKVPTGPSRGTQAPSRAASRFLELKRRAEDTPLGAAGNPVVFTDYDPLGTQAGTVGTPPDMNAARGGNVVMLSYNTNVLLSTNGANTYTLLNPTTIFPSGPATDGAGNRLDNGLCCDQVLQYVPQIDRFIWLMQFCGTGTNCLNGINKVRIASASPQQIINNSGTAWTYWDLFSSTFNLGTTTMDYPDLSVGDNFLYFSADAVGTGLLVVRIPLNELRDSLTINMNYTTPSDSGVAYGGHISQNTGDEIFWAGHNNNSQMRVFSMREGSGQYFWRDINVNSWPNGTISSIAKDGTTDWLQFLGQSFPGNAVLGAVRRTNTEVWFAWTAAQGSGFPRAHVQVVEINTANYTMLSQWQIWNNDYAFAFPSLATNAGNEVGVSLAWGGNQNFGNNAVGILGDFVVWYPELSDAAITRWGDYVSVRRNSPNTLMWDASGYAVFKQTPPATGTRFDPYYIQFGRNSVVNGGTQNSPIR
jgi:hypothetical protein